MLTSLVPARVKTLLHSGKQWLHQQNQLISARRRGIVLAPPNFVFRPLVAGDRIVDVGCGHDADFSITLLERYPGTLAYAFDPTQKHEDSLRALVESSNGRLLHYPIAVAAQAHEILFHESTENESGSTQAGHTNIQHDAIKTYPVKAIHLREIPALINTSTIELLKLDIEGEEFPLIDQLTREDLTAYKQLFIEFHHRQIEGLTELDTERCVRKIDSLGFTHFSTDRVNYLFYRTS